MSLVELLVSLTIAAIMVLMAGVIASTSQSSYHKAYQEAEVYGDISYAFQLMQDRVREAGAISQRSRSNWIGNQLVVDDQAFGLYQTSGPNKDLVFVPDKDNDNDREVILTVPDTAPLSFNVNAGAKSATVTLTGTKAGVTFDMSTVISKRAP